MKIQLSTKPIDQIKLDTLVCPMVNPPDKSRFISQLDSYLDHQVSRLIKQHKFCEKAFHQLTIPTLGRMLIGSIHLIGVLDEELQPGFLLRTSIAKAVRSTLPGTRSLGIYMSEMNERNLCWATEGLLCGLYRYSLKHEKEDDSHSPTTCTFIGATGGPKGSKASLRKSIQRGQHNMEGVELARDLTNTPANLMAPTEFTKRAKNLANKHDLSIKVYGPKQIRDHKLSLVSAVAQGSHHPGQFLHLVYKPKRSQGNIALVGKGITFDSGGLSLKTASGQLDMKSDMAGAATVLGVMKACALSQPNWRVEAFMPCCENMPGGGAIRPGDVVTSSGKSVEIRNTDAEGRLILADALAFAQKGKPDLIVDFATLTAACVVALGPFTAGLFANNEGYAKRFLEASRRCGEDFWRLPLNPSLQDQLKSPIADLKNVGTRWGGAITAALFLSQFVDRTPWLHIDMAGPAFLDKAHGFYPKGGTGFGVLTMMEFLAN